MFNKFLKKEKPRVFLGSLSVVPRTDFKKIDEWGIFHKEDIDAEFRHSLKEIFSLPPASEVNVPLKTDLVLDVVISQFQSGDIWSIDIIPVLWRPKVEIKSRLYSLKTKKTKSVFSVTEKLKWNTFFNRILSWRCLLRFRPVFDTKDMNCLLYRACHKLLLEMKNSL